MSIKQKIYLNRLQSILLQLRSLKLTKNKLIGKQGELVATDYLRSNGFGVISKNWTTKLGEIDLVAIKERNLIFIEVKTRKAVKHATYQPYDSVGTKKRKKLLLLADIYMERNKAALKKYRLRDYRIDILSIHKNSLREWVVEHLVGVT